MSIETMKMALEVLEQINKLSVGENAIALPGEIDAAMDSLRAAIEQAEKPVAWRWKALVNGEFVSNWVLTHSEPPPYATESMPLYAAPRQWVELTDEEVHEGFCHVEYETPNDWNTDPDDWCQQFARYLEAKLKEKNHG
jgi:hypothetical protein